MSLPQAFLTDRSKQYMRHDVQLSLLIAKEWPRWYSWTLTLPYPQGGTSGEDQASLPSPMTACWKSWIRP